MGKKKNRKVGQYVGFKPRTKKIAGKQYQCSNAYQNKQWAKDTAESFRKKGYSARVVKANIKPKKRKGIKRSNYKWGVYTRKTKWR